MELKPANRIEQVSEYYFSSKLVQVRSLKAAGKDIINLGIGNPDLPPHPSVQKELAKSSQRTGSHIYQSYQGIPELRGAFCDWYKRTYDVSLDPDSEVLPLMGSKEGIMHISMAFCDSGDRVLVPNPGYLTYTSVSRLLNLDVQHYNLTDKNNWLPDIKELDRLATSNCKIIWLNYPHMPTGSKASDEAFRELVAFAEERKILLVNDNPYSLVLNDNPISLLSYDPSRKYVLELNSLSKSHNMAGWRVGLVAGHEQNIKYILRVKSNFDSGMFKPVQEAATKALQLKEEWYTELNDIYLKRRLLIWKMLDQLGCSYQKNTAGMFVWAKVPDGFEDGDTFSDYLLFAKDIFAAPGSVFGSNGKQYIRFSLCAPEKDLEEAIERIGQKKESRCMILGVVGLGLIGGSMAVDLKKGGFCSKVIGVDCNAEHAIKALELGIIDEIANLEMAIKQSDIIIIAVPVDATLDLLPGLMDILDKQVVMDVGSTKSSICKSIKNHPKRANFVAAHPMAGTEFSGPEAAMSGLFNDKAAIICEIEKSSERAQLIVENLYNTLNMRTIYMDSESHDVHAAYVSHISHISSFALALTVLEQEKSKKNIFDLASGGFDSTVRLAKSSATMWAPILADNSENISLVLQTYIDRLNDFKKAIDAKSLTEITKDIKEANKIRKVLSKQTEPDAKQLTKQDWNN